MIQRIGLAVIALLAVAGWNTSCQDNPYQQGHILYDYHCSNCHMEDGSGLEGVIPPIAGADYMAENQDQLACIIRYGLYDTIVVNGVTYQQPMAGISELEPVAIVNIINYINHAWGNDYGLAKLEEVRVQLEKCRRPAR